MAILSKSSKPLQEQKSRFIEAAKKVGADESGKAFERAVTKVIARKKPVSSIPKPEKP